jgi:hypothetical protein
LAAQNPEGAVAEELETVGLRVLAYDLFTKTKAGIANLHENRPELSDQSTAGNSIADYEERIKGYLDAHTQSWRDIVQPIDKEPAEVRKAVLGKLVQTIVENEQGVSGFTQKAFTEIGMGSIDTVGLREGIARAAGDVTESVWSVVLQGRDSQADLMEGRALTEIAAEYADATDRYLTTASSIATDAIQKLNALHAGEQS